MDTTSITHLSLCSGYGGLDLGLKRVIPNLRTVAYCERESAAVELLLSRMESGHLDPAPIWSDLKSFPWGAFSGRVDLLSGGYPCQPFSAAGKRLGGEDERHLWPFISSGIRILRPRVCFFENVEGHITQGLHHVLNDLGGLGYRATWGLFSAAEVGAPHQRKRVFIWAYAADIRQKWSSITRSTATPSTTTGCGERIWPSRPGEQQFWWEPPRVVADTGRNQRKRRDSVGGVPCVNDEAQGAGEDGGCRGENQAGEWAQPESGSIGAEPAVGHTENQRRGRVDDESSASRSRETRGHTDRTGHEPRQNQRQAEPEVGGDADGAASWVGYAKLCVSSDNRTDELRMLGNGVVPATAAKAFETLMKELTK